MDKGAVRDGGANELHYKGVTLTPEYNKQNKLIGYNVFDDSNTGRNMPVLQLEPGDLESFKSNFSGIISGARLYYSNGEPSQGMKEASAGVIAGRYSMVANGVKKEWKGALHDPVWIAGALLATAGAGLDLATPKANQVDLLSPGYKPVATTSVPIKNTGVLNYLNRLQSGTWLKVYQAAYIDGKQVEVHFFLNTETGAYFDSKIKQTGWSSQFSKGGNKITGH